MSPSDCSPPAPRKDHWAKHAEQWQWFASPLRPCAQDIRIFEEIVARQSSETGGACPTVLLLGVTSEIALMGWPDGRRLIAVDHSLTMLRKRWPAAEAQQAMEVCGDWLHLPLPPHSVNMVIGDGFLTLLSYPDGFRRLAGALVDVLAPGGLLVIRCFVRPARPEGAATVFADLAAGRIGSFHAFKWRLAMALHGSTAADGVRLADIWQTWHEARVDTKELAVRFGWAAESIGTIDNYRGIATYYTFPTIVEVRQALAPFFQEQACILPEYELAERCPIMVSAPKVGGSSNVAA